MTNVRPGYEDRLRDTQRRFALGATQRDIRDLYGESEGVRLYWLVVIDRLFPKNRLIEKIISGEIDYKKIPPRILPGLAKSFRADVQDFVHDLV